MAGVPGRTAPPDSAVAHRRRAPFPRHIHVRPFPASCPAGAVNHRTAFPFLFRRLVLRQLTMSVRRLLRGARPAPNGEPSAASRPSARPAAWDAIRRTPGTRCRCGAPVPRADGRPPRRVRRARAAVLSTPSARPVRPVRTTRSRFRSLRPTTPSELRLRDRTRRHRATFRHTARTEARASIPVFDRAGTRSSGSLADGGANDGNRRESGRGAGHRCPLRRRDPVCDRPPYRTTTPPGGHRLVAAPGPASRPDHRQPSLP